MIISASRRTDLPAFYSKWFLNRIKAQYCTVFNPFNRNQVKYISLKPGDINVIVFWTRNSSKFHECINELDFLGIKYYFQYTLIKYDRRLHRSLPDFENLKNEFLSLSNRVGSEKIIWRYDPILISNEHDYNYHIKQFESLATILRSNTHRVIISIVDLYKKSMKNLKPLADSNFILNKNPESDHNFRGFIKELVKISSNNNMEIQSCAEPLDLQSLGVKQGKCIDDNYIKKVFGSSVTSKKDPFQRKECGCVRSIDIGVYDTCLHGCQYCYATTNHIKAKENFKLHDPDSPSLIGWYDANPIIDEDKQLKFPGIA